MSKRTDYVNEKANEGFNAFMWEMLAIVPRNVPDIVLESFYKRGFADALTLLKKAPTNDKDLHRTSPTPTTPRGKAD